MFVNKVLLLGLGAGICTAVGAALLFVKRNWSDRSLAGFLGLASGVMIAVVIFDMLPSALISGAGSAFAGALVGIAIMGLFNLLIFQHKGNLENTLVGLGYLIMLGIALHDLPEGMAIALGDEMKARTGMVI
ncbi:MAG: ZIP family metal transporter, partial [Syntrophomonadaceae bacterium]|nr:ZIP family metal transporter [Syntrophomonadaceae bacterium]